MNMKIGFFGLFTLIFSGFCANGLGCAVERTEYHYRSQSMADAMGRPVDETYVKPDGTKVIYSAKQPQLQKDTDEHVASPTPQTDLTETDLRAKKANGDVVLQATFPEQVVDHMLECVRNEEYDLMWNQLLSTQAKKDLEPRGGLKYFKTFFQVNRKEVMATLNCMKINFKNGHVMIYKNDDTHLSAQLDSTLRTSYRFALIDFESTPTGMKLVSIR